MTAWALGRMHTAQTDRREGLDVMFILECKKTVDVSKNRCIAIGVRGYLQKFIVTPPITIT